MTKVTSLLHRYVYKPLYICPNTPSSCASTARRILLASPLPPAPCLVAAASLFARSDNLGIILISFWCHFWDLWASFGDHWALVWDTWARSLFYGGPYLECNDFVSGFWTLRGSPFSPLGVTISFPWVWNDGNPIFCWQPDSRSDFRTKSDQFLRCLGQ